MSNLRIAFLAAFCGSAALAGLSLAPSVARAGFASHSALNCTTNNGTKSMSGDQQGNFSNDTSLVLKCPVNSDEGHLASGVNAALTVNGYQNGHVAKSYHLLCRVYGAGNGGRCGTIAYAPNSNSTYYVVLNGNLPSNAPVWQAGSALDGYTLMSVLAPGFQGSFNTLFSYYLGG